MPYLADWHKKYHDKGFTIIGVHAPEFDFERDPDNVRWALEHYNIEYPVVLDNHFRIWHAYANAYWPRKYLVLNGKIAYDHIGEGGYHETELNIRRLLQQANPELDLSDIPVVEDKNPVCYTPTPETYCGFSRGYLNNPGDFRSGREYDYEDPGTYRKAGLYLNGRWSSQRQFLEHVGKSASDYLVLSFDAVSINLVIASPQNKPATFSLEFDGAPLSEDVRGDDVKDSKITISDPRMYNIFRADQFTSGTLKLKDLPPGIRLYAFSFGGCIGVI